MKIELHVYEHPDEDVLTSLEKLRSLIMATAEQFEAGFKAVNDETTRIGDLIVKLTTQINTGNLTDEQETAALVALTAAGERLKAVGATVEVPVPPADPVIEEAVRRSSR